MAKTRKIICRADGNSKTGLGHLYRMIAITNFLNHQFDVSFLTKEDSEFAVIPESIKIVKLPSSISVKQEPNWLCDNFEPENTIIIFDGYDFGSEYQKELNLFGFKTILIDDLANHHVYADVVVNHATGINPQKYSADFRTELALGTKYSMLRPLFCEAAKNKRDISGTENRIFVCFGGSDTLNLTLKATIAALKINSIDGVLAVVGQSYTHKEIFELEKASPKLKVYKNLNEKELIKAMQTCQLAFSSASTIVYELSCVKMPILSGYYVDNQKELYAGLAQAEAIVPCGNISEFTIRDFEQKIREVISSSDREKYLERQIRLFDGLSPRRFRALINHLNVTFRKASLDDLEIVFNWSNDSLVRSNSYQTSKITIKEHTAWFVKKIKEENTLFYIVLVGETKAGIIRYSLDEDHSVIGVLVSEPFRGQGLAAVFIKNSLIELKSEYVSPVLAYIKEENVASKKAFETAGFTFYKNELVQGCPSFVYKFDDKYVQ